MPLKTRHKLPPGGWIYREPSTGWVMPADMRTMPFTQAVEAILTYRLNNPIHGLSTSFEHAAKDLEEQTCLRVPDMCMQSQQEIQTKLRREAAERQLVADCPTCGRKKK